MKWKNIKTLLIILFTAVTVYLSVMIGIRYRETYYISDQVMRDAIELLGNAGIKVSEEIIPKKLTKYDVVEGEYSKNYFADNTGISSKFDDFTSYATPTGSIKYINNVNGSAYEHFSPFGIVYQKTTDSIAGVDYKYEISDSDVEIDVKTIESKVKNEMIELFGSGTVSRESGSGFSVRVMSAYHDQILGIYKVNLIQTVNGCEIYGNNLYVEIDASGLTYLSGNMILNKSHSSYTADLYDQINILFIEKSHLDSSEEETEGKIDKTVTGMETVYCVTWSYDRSKFYLIPSWKIVYADGTDSIINAINGKVYVD